jgi:hypothetical protein
LFSARSIYSVVSVAKRSAEGPTCPLCREPFTKKQLEPPPKPPAPVEESKECAAAAAAASDAPVPDNIVFSSKIDALMTQLLLLQREHPNAKALVFSQFTQTINTVADRSDIQSRIAPPALLP